MWVLRRPKGYETTGFIEPVDGPRPPASTGKWTDVWARMDGKDEKAEPSQLSPGTSERTPGKSA
jgi:hypothetical protein